MSWDLLQRFIESDVFNQNPFLSVSYLSSVAPSGVSKIHDAKHLLKLEPACELVVKCLPIETSM